MPFDFPTAPANGTEANGYVWDGLVWNIKPGASTSTKIGAVMYGLFLDGDPGWIRMDGRAVSTLTATQQAAAASLGFTTNLPDATDAVAMQKAGVMGSISGSWTLTQANLPAVNLTAASAGDHQHKINVYDGSIDKNMYSLVDNQQPTVHWASTLMCATSGGGDVSLNEYGNVMENAGPHTHTVALGGAGTPIAPRALTANCFVYLGP